MLLVSVLFLGFIAILFFAGSMLLHWAGFRARYRVDLFLASFTCGLALTSLLVYLLLLANAYFIGSALVLAFGPLGYLAWRAKNHDLAMFAAEENGILAGLPANPLDHAAALMCLVFLSVGFVDALSSPFILWDSIVSWDKWATEWALRSNMYDRLLGYYPQLLPMASSVLYKLTGTANDVMPSAQYALHAFQPFLGLILVVAVLRLAHIFEVPAWPSLLILFGSATLRVHMTAGAADAVASAMFAAAAAIYFSATRADITARRGFAAILSVVFFGAFFAKANNLTFLLVLLSSYLLIRSAKFPSLSLPKGLGTAVQIALLLFGTFLLHQYLNIGTPPEDVLLSELNFDPKTIGKTLANTSTGSMQASSLLDRLYLGAERIIGVYEFPQGLTKPIAFASILALFLCAFSPRFWPILVTFVAQVALWSQITAYDTRNLLSGLPLLGLCVTRGFVFAHSRLRPIGLAPVLLSLLLVTFSVWPAGRIAADVFRLGGIVIEEFAARRAVLVGDAAARIALFFPKEFPAYQFMTSLRPFREAKHVMVGSRMYRFLPNGGYPLSFWSAQNLVPGDGYAVLPSFGLPYPERWTGVYDDGEQRLFLLDKEPKILRPQELLLTGDTPPRLVENPPAGPWSVEGTGAAGFVVYNLPYRSLKEGDSLTWRVIVSGKASDLSSLASAYVTYDPAIIDPKRSRVLADASRSAENLLTYSGILTFSGKMVSERVPLDGILVGISVRKPGFRVQVNEFRVSLYK